MLKKIFISLLLWGFFYGGYAQINGVVLNASDSVSIEGVHILKDGELVAVTSPQGQFVIDSRFSGNYVFQHVAYASDTIALQPDSDGIVIYLTPDNREISGPAIRGYGYTDSASQQLAGISVIQPEALDATTVVNPSAVLNSVPGLYFHRGARNTQRLSIRGAGARSMYATTRLKTYLNGVPLSSAMGEVFLDDLLWSQVSQVSIIKGPVPPIYGSSTGGVFLMNDLLEENAQTAITSGVTAGSFGYMHQQHQFQTSKGNLAGSIQYQSIDEDGFRKNDDYSGNSFRTLLRYDFRGGHALHYFLDYTRMKAYIPSSLSSEVFRNNPAAAASNWLEAQGYEENRQIIQGMTLKSTYNPVFSHETTLFGISRQGDERRPFNTLSDIHRAGGLRTILTAQRFVKGPGELFLQGGGTFRYGEYKWNTTETLPEDQKGALLSDQKQNRHRAEFFLNASYHTGRITAEVGINLSNTGYTIHNLMAPSVGAASYEPGIVVAPYFSTRYQLTRHTGLFAAIGRGHTAPVFEEAIDSEGNINTELLPENSWKREVGWVTGRPALKIRSSLYFNSVSDQLITKRVAEDAYIKENAGKTEYAGAEVLIKWKIVNSQAIKLSSTINYAYSHFTFREFVDEGADYSGNKVPGIPAHQGGASLEVLFRNALHLHYRWMGISKMPMNDSNDRYYGGHQLMNLDISYRKKIMENFFLKGYTRLGNITDKRYAAMILVNAQGYGGADPRYYYPGAPANFHAGLRVNYIF